jgi:uncharacterized protein YbjQ (UPF0145 family)
MLTFNTADAGRPYRVISLIDGVGEADSPVDSKNMAMAVMTKRAKAIPADAIVNVRFTHSLAVVHAWGFREFHTTIASGTAVRFI